MEQWLTETYIDRESTEKKIWAVSMMLSACDQDELFSTEMTSSSGNSTIPSRAVALAYGRPRSRHFELTSSEVLALTADERIESVHSLDFIESLVEPFEVRKHPPSLSAAAPHRQNGSSGQTFTFDSFSDTTSNQASYTAARVPAHKWLTQSSLYYHNYMGYLSGQLDAPGSEINTESRTDGVSDVTSVVVADTAFYNQGQDVDVIITDDPVSKDMEEWKDPDTGASRFVEYDWFNSTLESHILSKLNNSLPSLYRGSQRAGLGKSSNYKYRSNSDNPYFHGIHVASTACGQWYGYARKANIYSINVLRSDEASDAETYGYIPTSYFADFILAFHETKPVNPRTGKRNPTIVNASWGSSYTNTMQGLFPNGIQLSDISGFTALYNPEDNSDYYDRGQGRFYSSSLPPTHDGDGTWTVENLSNSFGIKFNTEGWRIPAASNIAAQNSNIGEMIQSGIVFVNAAGNDDWYCENSAAGSFYTDDKPDGFGYDLSINLPDTAKGPRHCHVIQFDGVGTLRYANAPNPTHPAGITVGSLGLLKKPRKSYFSNYGPCIDVWAYGESVLGAYNNTGVADGKYGGAGVHQYYKTIGGTSMAAPQVTGVLACAASNKSRFTPSDAINYLHQTGLSGGIYHSQGWLQSYTIPNSDSASYHSSDSITAQLSGTRFSDETHLESSENLQLRFMNPRSVLSRSFSAYPNSTDATGIAGGFNDGKNNGLIVDGGHYQILKMDMPGTDKDNAEFPLGINNDHNDTTSYTSAQDRADGNPGVTGGQAAQQFVKKGARAHQDKFYADWWVGKNGNGMASGDVKGPLSYLTESDVFDQYEPGYTKLTKAGKRLTEQRNFFGRFPSNQKFPRQSIYMDTSTVMLSTLASDHNDYAAEVAGGNSSAVVTVLATDPTS